jgi:hypothetical protein
MPEVAIAIVANAEAKGSRMPRILSAVLVGIFAVAPFAWSTPAHAGSEDMKACAAAAEKGQRLRNDGKLKEAREQLVICARNVCPGVIRKDCEPLLNELDSRVPTVVIAAKDAAGNDVIDVRVTIDGTVVASKLDGKAITIDPGAHTIRYEHDGSVAIDANVLVHDGEKDHVLNVVFEPIAAKKEDGTPVPVEKEKEKPQQPEKSGPPIGGFVLGGVGVVAVGSFVFFDLSAKSSADDLRTTCAPRCAQSDVDSINTKIIVADVSLGAGVVALGVATWLIVSHYAAPKPQQIQIGLGSVSGRF